MASTFEVKCLEDCLQVVVRLNQHDRLVTLQEQFV